MIMEQECLSGLLPEFACYAGAGSGSGGNAEARPGVSQKF